MDLEQKWIDLKARRHFKMQLTAALLYAGRSATKTSHLTALLFRSDEVSLSFIPISVKISKEIKLHMDEE